MSADRGAEPVPGALAALARGTRSSPAFLRPHHLAAAVRVQKLFVRARLAQRVTMHYESVPSGGRRRAGGVADLADSAAEARKALAALHGELPRDCASVLIDVCGFEKGLQLVETERGWPRRSAKLVLRIALECAASRFGIGAIATGPEASTLRSWREKGAKPTEVG